MEKIKIDGGKVFLNGMDITDRPVWNYIACAGRKGFVVLEPSPMEDRSEGTCIMQEVDDDRYYYVAYFKGEEIGWYSHKWQAEDAILGYEQRQYDMEEACMDLDCN